MTNYISKINNNKLSADRPEGVKVNTVVITYTSTEGDVNKAVTTMFERGTSVHYTIKLDGFQDQHHSESQKAFYAGASHWHGVYGVNDYAIGIMLVNDAKSNFTDAQMNQLIALIKDIEVRHDTKMEVVGLGEVNKAHIAPGAFFPWNKLAEAGIGKAVVMPEGIDRSVTIKLGDSGENVANLQQKLQTHGYQVPQTGTYDEVTAKFAQNFINRYAPEAEHDSEVNFSSNLANWNNAAEYALDDLLGLHSTTASEL